MAVSYRKCEYCVYGKDYFNLSSLCPVCGGDGQLENLPGEVKCPVCTYGKEFHDGGPCKRCKGRSYFIRRSALPALMPFHGMRLHPTIVDASEDLYKDGHYRNAVFDACTALILMVQERSGKHDLSGAPLMFSKESCLLSAILGDILSHRILLTKRLNIFGS